MSLGFYQLAIVTVAGGFTPADLTPNLWVDPSDLSTLFQSNAGSTAVSTDGTVVGYAGDKSGAGFHLTSAADDTTRPTYNTDGTLRWLTFDGSNDVLRRTADLGCYSAGATSMFLAMRGNPAGTGLRLFAIGSSAGTNPFYAIQSSGGGAANGAMFGRDDVGATVGSLSGSVPSLTNAFDNTDRVVGYTDDGSTATGYLNVASGVTASSTHSGHTLTLNRTALGALIRTTTGNWFAARVYGLVVVNRVITSTERGNLITWLGAKAGLTL